MTIHINIVGKEDENSKRWRVEKLHIETGVYIRYLKYALFILQRFCDEIFGFSKPVKGLLYFNKTLMDLKVILEKIVCEETGVNFPCNLIYSFGIDNEQLELFLKQERLYQVNFKIPIFEKIKPQLLHAQALIRDKNSRRVESITLSLDQYRMIERINVLLTETTKQLSFLIKNNGYNRVNQRRLFLAIDRFAKWYRQSKNIFDKSSKHCDRFRKNIKLILMANKYDKNSIFSRLPREIIRVIIDYVW